MAAIFKDGRQKGIKLPILNVQHGVLGTSDICLTKNEHWSRSSFLILVLRLKSNKVLRKCPFIVVNFAAILDLRHQDGLQVLEVPHIRNLCHRKHINTYQDRDSTIFKNTVMSIFQL